MLGAPLDKPALLKAGLRGVNDAAEDAGIDEPDARYVAEVAPIIRYVVTAGRLPVDVTASRKPAPRDL
ncbi:hypothetical protein [Caballeronia sp.]|uniref:hypothetical protein n=1 Tax=Caballeronia sp. TaxID=1931223 RepID=UPI003C69FA73